MAGLKVPELKVPEKVGDLGSYLREQRESARLSLRQLASAAGVSNPYLSQIERGLRKPSAEVLQGIAKGLQISAEALFQRAGLLENTGGAEVEAAIQNDVRLTSRQKRVLLDIYATFRAENGREDASRAHGEPAQQAADQPVDHPDQPMDHQDQPEQPEQVEREPAPVVHLRTSTPATAPAPRTRAKKRAQGH